MNNNAINTAALDLDNQVQEKNRLIAGDERRIQGVEEQRYNAELAGIGQQMATGEQNIWSGIRGVANAGMSFMSNLNPVMATNVGSQRGEATKVAINPMGITSTSGFGRMNDLSALGDYQKKKSRKRQYK